jgi:hypothetical protein|tara:strand:- start:31803 stop:31943 length:141 start_codon:yes stop_codon:yes gene_type:complete
MSDVVTIIVAILAVLLVWKLLKGAAKTIALLVILAAAALFIFGVGA